MTTSNPNPPAAWYEAPEDRATRHPVGDWRGYTRESDECADCGHADHDDGDVCRFEDCECRTYAPKGGIWADLQADERDDSHERRELEDERRADEARR